LQAMPNKTGYSFKQRKLTQKHEYKIFISP
jgi:hypothetical protein